MLVLFTQGVECRMVLVVNFFRIFKINFCFVVAISDLVHNVEAKISRCCQQLSKGK